MRLDPRYLAFAFHEGAIELPEGVGAGVLVHRPIGSLDLPSGRLVACDPFVFAGNTDPFLVTLPSGPYAIVLVVLQMATDQRVAFARLDVSPGRAERWEMMTVVGQDLATLAPEEFFGYGVDSGTGGFADEAAMAELSRLMEGGEEYFEKIYAEMMKTYVDTWSWIDWRLPSGGNVMAFSSGWGDGAYPTYVAYDSSGQIVSVVTDFLVLDDIS